MTKFDLLGATALAMFFANPALAQTTPAAEAPQADDASIESEEIIVTASKREQTLQDTPISVSVTTGEAIQQSQVRDLLDLQNLVPSLRVSQNQNSAATTFIIRGFGNGANNPGIEPSVGVFIDGVYRSRSAAQISDLPNLKRVEVLRGPQSTLFGKNASAGIISVVTAEPNLNKFEGSVEGTYGNFDAIIVKGDITGPISETLAFSLAGNYNKRDGYARDLNLNQDANNRNRYGFRGQLLFEPSDALKFRLIADYDNIDEECCVVANVVNGPTGAAVFALGGRIDPENPFSFNVFNNLPSTNKIDNGGVSLQGDYEVGKFTLTSISAYRKSKSKTNQDSDFTSADLIGSNLGKTDIDTITQEVRIASDFDGPLNFLLGGYYFNEKIDFANDLTFGRDFRRYVDILSSGGVSTLEQQILRLPANTFGQTGQGAFDRFKFKNDSFSIFGQVDFELGDKLTLTGGFNYTNDKKRVSSNSISTDAFSALDLVAIGVPVVQGGAVAAGVGQALRGPNGAPASAAEIAAFAGAQAAIFAAISAGATAFANSAAGLAANPLLPLRPLQFLPPFLNFPNAVENGKTSDSDFSYTLRLAYKISPRFNSYFTYATGFKATSFNLSRDSRPSPADFIAGSPVTNPPASRIRTAGLALPNLTSGSRFAGPENSSVYELGLKGNLPGLQFNLAVFKQIIKGFQSNTFIGTGFVLANAGKQSTKGAELEVSVTPIKPLNFSFALTYLDPVFDSFVNSAVGDISGQRPAGIPTYSISVGGSYAQDIGGDNKLIFRTDFSHESKVQTIEGNPQFQREVNLLNAAAILQLSNGFELSVFGRNLTNDQILTTVFPSVAQAGSFSGYPSQPRTYGVSGRFKF
jgi:iron complex outermembrane recepter protein